MSHRTERLTDAERARWKGSLPRVSTSLLAFFGLTRGTATRATWGKVSPQAAATIRRLLGPRHWDLAASYLGHLRQPAKTRPVGKRPHGGASLLRWKQKRAARLAGGAQ